MTARRQRIPGGGFRFAQPTLPTHVLSRARSWLMCGAPFREVAMNVAATADIAAPLRRHQTVPVRVGGIIVGGGAPVVVQSMTNTDTADVESTARQVAALARAGS